MSWLVFFPITFWKTVTRPLKTMEYADSELLENADSQCSETLSPPLFLLLALLLSHALELMLTQDANPIVSNTSGLAAYIDSDTKLLMLRMIFFSIIPLVIAAVSLMGGKRRITRDSLKAPFYAQCYPAGVFALTIGCATLIATRALPIGSLIALIVVAAYLLLQIAWFRRNLQRSVFVATGYAAFSLIAGSACGILLALFFV